jgi:hypothetical protein
MRREPDFFGKQELVRVYVARRLKEALAVEELLDAGALDYAVEAAPFTSGVLFFSRRVGAFFYVAPETLDRARASIVEGGLDPYLVK